MGTKILYVEDDSKQRQIICKLLRRNEYHVIEAPSPIEAINVLNNEQIDIIVSDFRMPEMNGDKFLEEVKKINPYVSFIMVTAYGNINLAVKTIKSGAVDFLTKPFEFDNLLDKIKHLEKKIALDNEIKKARPQKQSEPKINMTSIIGKSVRISEVLSKVDRVAKSEMPVLITGESGTGKELVADLIHKLSIRSDKPYVKVNCGAITENLIESELFGYEKGAFSGASNQKKGLIETADGGTLFLDEIGELPFPIQSKLLRFLQNSEVRRIGSNKIIRINVRVISATNRNLADEVNVKAFRNDLYYRLNVVNPHLPPLRERKEDIPLLAKHFLEKYSNENNMTGKTLSRKTMDKLIKYDYSGNIRELENIIKNALILSMGEVIEPEDIPVFISNEYEHENSLELPDKPIDIESYISDIEKRIIINALDKNEWSRIKTAEYLNITERVLRYKMNKFSIKK